MSLLSVYKDYKKAQNLNEQLIKLEEMAAEARLKYLNGKMDYCTFQLIMNILTEEEERIRREILSLGFEVAEKQYPYSPSKIPKP